MTRSASNPVVASAAPAQRPLRLAYLTTKYPAVSHTFIRRELLELERRGHHILRLAIRRADASPPDSLDKAEEGKTIHCLEQPKSRMGAALAGIMLANPARAWRALRRTITLSRRSDRGLARHLAYLIEACTLLRIVRRERIEHIHVHFGTNAAAVALLMRDLGGPPYSITIHGPDEFDAPIGLSLGDKVEGASFVAAITRFCAGQIKRWVSPEHWGKVYIIGCTVGDEFFSAAAPLDPNSRDLLCIGRLNAQKGHMLLLEAFAEVVRTGGQGNLILAGDGELRPQIEARIAELNLTSRVRITGWIGEAEVRRLLLSCRALVLASLAEGLPMVLMEALALGRPVIATAIAGIPELVQPGRTGWLVTSGDAPALAAEMREVLAAPIAEVERLAAAGRDLVRRDHDTATEAAKLESIIRSSLEAHR